MARNIFLHRWLDHNWLYDRYFVIKSPAVWIKRNRYLRGKRDSSSSFLPSCFTPRLVTSTFRRRLLAGSLNMVFILTQNYKRYRCWKLNSLTCHDDNDRWLIRNWSLQVIRQWTIRKLPTHRVIAATCFETKWPRALLLSSFPFIMLLYHHFCIDNISSAILSFLSFIFLVHYSFWSRRKEMIYLWSFFIFFYRVFSIKYTYI